MAANCHTRDEYCDNLPTNDWAGWQIAASALSYSGPPLANGHAGFHGSKEVSDPEEIVRVRKQTCTGRASNESESGGVLPSIRHSCAFRPHLGPPAGATRWRRAVRQ